MASLKQEPTLFSIATLSHPNPNPNPNPTPDPPMAVPLLLSTPPPRRLPPPCWTPDETSALIDSYRHKWYSLRRANLRAAHWHDVALQIHDRCPHVVPPKTAVQCRHKMEKLRKRYRAELLRANSLPHHRFSSSWIYFSRMDSMENNNDSPSPGSLPLPSPVPLSQSPSPAFIAENYGADFTIRMSSNRDSSPLPNPNYGHKSTFPQFNGATFVENHDNTTTTGSSRGAASHGGGGVNYVSVNVDELSGGGKKRKVDGERGKEKREEAAMEMVDAIRTLGEGFVKMETMKLEMMRETERMRMEMEMKRTEMLLQSQHRLVQAFANGWAEVINNSSNNDDE